MRIIAAIFLAAGSLLAQVEVPFVGCKSDGQVGPVDAPASKSVRMPIDAKAAQKLAHYESAEGLTVLAPRGWNCFGTVGSSGDVLYVSPEPLDSKRVFGDWSGFEGPAIQISLRFGSTSGRYAVAQAIARVFPAYIQFVKDVIESFDMKADEFPVGPYPQDILVYNGKSLVRFKTPAQTEGLGTRSFLKKNSDPIEGVAMLVGDETNLVQLCVRLPASMRGLTSEIVRQTERDYPSKTRAR